MQCVPLSILRFLRKEPKKRKASAQPHSEISKFQKLVFFPIRQPGIHVLHQSKLDSTILVSFYSVVEEIEWDQGWGVNWEAVSHNDNLPEKDSKLSNKPIKQILEYIITDYGETMRILWQTMKTLWQTRKTMKPLWNTMTDYDRLWQHYHSAVYVDPHYEHYDTVHPGQLVCVLLMWSLLLTDVHPQVEQCM